MARNGAAESGRCSSGQWGAADGGIGRAPAVNLGQGCGMGWSCKGLSKACRTSKRRRIRELWREKKEEKKKLANPGWALSAQRLETLLGVFTAGAGMARDYHSYPKSLEYKAAPGTLARSVGDGR